MGDFLRPAVAVPRQKAVSRQGPALLLYADVYLDKADILFMVVSKVQ